DHALERERVTVRRDEAVEMRKLRRRARSHVGEQNSAALDHRISLLPHVGAEWTVFRLRRRLKTLAGDIEQPSVERTAQAAVFEPAVREIGAAMRARTF